MPNFPLSHALQMTLSIAAHLPTGQSAHMFAELTLYLPAEQPTQTRPSPRHFPASHGTFVGDDVGSMLPELANPELQASEAIRDHFPCGQCEQRLLLPIAVPPEYRPALHIKHEAAPGLGA